MLTLHLVRPRNTPCPICTCSTLLPSQPLTRRLPAWWISKRTAKARLSVRMSSPQLRLLPDLPNTTTWDIARFSVPLLERLCDLETYIRGENVFDKGEGVRRSE